MRLSDATLAFARPRSTWLRKLSERSARSATVLSVARRRRRISPEALPDVDAFELLYPGFSDLRVHQRKLKRHYSAL